jgi:hypothetical protein
LKIFPSIALPFHSSDSFPVYIIRSGIIEAPRRKRRGAAIRWLVDKHQRMAYGEVNALTGFNQIWSLKKSDHWIGVSLVSGI